MTTIERSAVLLALALSLGACATTTLAPPERDAADRRFDAPADKGALYIYRESVVGFAFNVNASLDGQLVSILGYDTWTRREIAPGRHSVECSGGEKPATTNVDLAAGEVRYVEIALRPGLSAPTCGVFEVTPQQGQAAIAKGKRVQDLR